jgi:phenylacetate-coenzyme A ligase PaaK-like adenylate-forming protein
MEHVNALAQNRSGVVVAYPILLWRAVIRARQEKIALPRYRVVQVGGEVLPDAMRRTIGNALGAPIRQIFGATDYGRMAIDCAQGHLHISPEATYIEIIANGRSTDSGEVGEIVVTNFASHARPLVRIRTGDFGAWGAEKCPCGNPLPYLAHIAGRQADRIILPDKRVVYWPDVEQALQPVKNDVFGYQAQQTGPASVLVRLTLDTNHEVSSLHVNCLRALFAGMSLEVEKTDALQSESSGKTRIVMGQPEYSTGL